MMFVNYVKEQELSCPIHVFFVMVQENGIWQLKDMLKITFVSVSHGTEKRAQFVTNLVIMILV